MRVIGGVHERRSDKQKQANKQTDTAPLLRFPSFVWMVQLPEDHLLPQTPSTFSNWAPSKHSIFQIYVYIALNPIAGGTVTQKEGRMDGWQQVNVKSNTSRQAYEVKTSAAGSIPTHFYGCLAR